jgi:hypothetical protein
MSALAKPICFRERVQKKVRGMRTAQRFWYISYLEIHYLERKEVQL